MLYELIIVILISIFTTALLFSIAKILQKILKIYHPKNIFWIYIIVLLTAISIIPLSSIAFSTPETIESENDISLLDTEEIVVSKSMFITNVQNTTYSSTIRPLPSNIKDISSTGEISRYLQQISWNEYIYSEEPIFHDETINQEPPLKSEKFIEAALSLTSHDSLESKTPQRINQMLTNLLINQNINNDFIISPETPTTDETQNQNIIMIAFFFLLLLFISISYIVFNLFSGKKHILKKLRAEQCKNDNILSLVKRISNEFQIKKPQVYLFSGPANAFVFGYPTTIAISNKLYTLLNEEEFEAAIRHEIAHVKNHDIFIKPILQGLRIFFFYNPIVHLVTKQIMNSREILADNSTFKTKKQKIMLMEALIKIAEQNNDLMIKRKITPSYLIPLISYHSSKITLSERFSNLFTVVTKRSLLTALTIIILLSTNMSLFLIADNVGEKQEKNEVADLINVDFSIDDSYYKETYTYTKFERNSKTYFALIIHRNLYNVISTHSSINSDHISQSLKWYGIPELPQSNCKLF